jgi:hypothetical protein
LHDTFADPTNEPHAVSRADFLAKINRVVDTNHQRSRRECETLRGYNDATAMRYA